MVTGVVFDWDGVVIDSSSAHERSWEALAAETGKTLPHDHFERSFGRKNQVIIPEILGWTHHPDEIESLGTRKETLYREIITHEGINPLPGVDTLLQRLDAAAIPCAVGSSTPRINIDTILPLLGLGNPFQSIFTAENVTHGKPHPEIFLKAAASLQSPPATTVVFEDAVYGIEAALAGNMIAIAVSPSRDRQRFPNAHRIVARLDELTVEDLHSLTSA